MKPILIIIAVILLALGLKYAWPESNDPQVSFSPSVSVNPSVSTTPADVISSQVYTVPASEFTSTTGWRSYTSSKHKFSTMRPANWYVLEPSPTPPPGETKNYIDPILFSTSQSGNAYDFDANGTAVDNPNWARISFQLYEKDTNQTLEQWLINRATNNSGPDIDSQLQYVQIGDKKFIGNRGSSVRTVYTTTDSGRKVMKIYLEFPNRAATDVASHTKTYLSVLRALKFN